MRWSCLVAAVLAGGCPSPEPPPACTIVDLGCTPQYVPTFDNVYANTLRMDCGSARGACHSASGEGGLSLADPETAHAELLAGRVTPGDPACSETIVRTQDHGKDYSMPPGGALVAAERCALVQWVAAGAPGPGEPLSTWSPR
jgi:hypothetical protein